MTQLSLGHVIGHVAILGRATVAKHQEGTIDEASPNSISQIGIIQLIRIYAIESLN
jgi:hypothetical protein